MPKKNKVSRRGLLLSLLTLVIALAVAGTSTYAWFAVNRSVTASNMQVTVKNDTTYLVIKESATPITDVDDLGTAITVTATASDAEVLPVRYRETGSDPTTGNTRWETARGEDYDDADAKDNEYTAVATADLDDYVVKYTFYVGLTPTTALPATNLMVTGLTATANAGVSNVFLPAISCLVVCGSTAIDFENVNSNGVKNTPNAVISSAVALDTVYTIDVYVYVNGEHENVTSENATAANLGGFKLEMTLGCTPGSEA